MTLRKILTFKVQVIKSTILIFSSIVKSFQDFLIVFISKIWKRQQTCHHWQQVRFIW